jgi:hypothetical protein
MRPESLCTVRAPRAHLLVVVLIALSSGAAGCGRLRPAGPTPPLGTFEVIGSYILPEMPVGPARDTIAELSGAWYDEGSGKIFVVSDRRDRPGIFSMRLEMSSEIRLVPEQFTPVEPPFEGRTLDLEGIAPAPDGRLFLASEGEDVNPERPALGIYEYTREGRFVRKIHVPGAYAGLRTNAAFEGLTISPDRRLLFAASEGSLRQDGPAATFDSGSINRILVLDLDNSFEAREYAYRTEPVPRLPDERLATGDNGISEILAIGEHDLLVLERAYVTGIGTGARSANAVRVYRVHLGEQGLITGRWSLSDAPPETVLTKTLVVDLSTIAAQLPPRLKNLENFEAMSFGPTLPDGRRTLLLISDNNCSDTQVSALVVLAFGNGRR